MSYYNILPFSLSGKCIDADEGLNPETWLLDQDVFVDCNAGDVGQDWILHQQGNIVQWESALHPGYCIATEHEHNVVDEYGIQTSIDHAVLAATYNTVAGYATKGYAVKNSWGKAYVVAGPNTNTNTTIDACINGVVGLMHCENPATQWYDAGSHLLSLTCWNAGYSTALTVVGDDDDTLELKSVQVEDVITTDSQFMFVESASSSDGGLGTGGWFTGWKFPGPGNRYSDRRLKHEITLIDKSPSGIPIYTFKYRSGMELANGEVLDSKSTFVGAMAQDLLEIAPDAVIMNEGDGFYRVDYSKIDVDFHKL